MGDDKEITLTGTVGDDTWTSLHLFDDGEDSFPDHLYDDPEMDRDDAWEQMNDIYQEVLKKLKDLEEEVKANEKVIEAYRDAIHIISESRR